MKTSIWHHTADKNPDKSGYYLSYRGFGMGGMSDYDHANGYMYYNKKEDEWYEYSSSNDSTPFVYYWTDADPKHWVDTDPPLVNRKKILKDNPALEIAWNNIQEAIRQFEIIKALT